MATFPDHAFEPTRAKDDINHRITKRDAAVDKRSSRTQGRNRRTGRRTAVSFGLADDLLQRHSAA
jgi:hypothetical protein